MRTDPASKRNQGISVLLVPMDLPGIEVREIPSVVGERYFHEVFLTDVRVPASLPARARGRGLGRRDATRWPTSASAPRATRAPR